MTSISTAGFHQMVAGLPGRLGRPELELGSDPRSDPRMVAALAPFGLDKTAAPPPVGPEAPREALLEFCAAAEAGFEGLLGALAADLPPVEGVASTTQTIQGVDGNEISLYIVRPSNVSGPLPCVLQIHGGGMVILRTAGPLYARFREELAAKSLVVVGVEYRNGGGALGSYPFPAGLDDCMTALAWVDAHRDELGISTITVAGESGGGNLTLATALRTKRESKLHMIDGVYALVPYISGIYNWSEADRRDALPSLVENDGYFISSALGAVLVEVYDPGAAHRQDPLCWPLFATEDDLRGLPPHVISINEVDPLRDEGLAYYRKLLAAGVDATGRTVLGACHAGDMLFRGAIPDMYAATIQDVYRFASTR
jgi:acetyl esterase